MNATTCVTYALCCCSCSLDLDLALAYPCVVVLCATLDKLIRVKFPFIPKGRKQKSKYRKTKYKKHGLLPNQYITILNLTYLSKIHSLMLNKEQARTYHLTQKNLTS